ncbi:transcriptional regulator, PadR family [Sporolactobacillus nakayamae]|uniref:Transcriptional regulator, PadR family n=2 Tax=Sporolactobacillus nakayamae TaxID=269670 RepID=A0A1I2PJZ4_9BACL|nr:transcriptional regulator, PadR family [Sporolactobacillus nakayamae]
MQNVSVLSGGRVELGAGTLYGAINTLLKKRWIMPWETNKSSRKKEYVITDLGKGTVDREMKRLTELLENSKKIVGGETHAEKSV